MRDSPPAQLEHRTSWNYNLSSYEAKRLLNLTEEPGLEHVGTMSEIRTTVATETDARSSNPTHPPSAPITRANSDASLYNLPVRRRSIIQTPGVATRSISTRELPPLPLNFRHSHPPTPSLSRKHSVESYRSGIVSMPPRLQDPDSMPRVETPSEDKYLSIGAFKLGSLRITNGSPSPRTPETDRARGSDGQGGTGQVVTRDGYFLGPQPLGSPPVTLTRLLPEIGRSSSSSPTQTQPASAALQTTSKVTAQEDQLFDDEMQPEYSAVLEVLDLRLDSEAKLPHLLAEHDTTPDIARTNSDSVSAAGPAPEIQYNSLAKADSGYSSDVSLRSFHAKPAIFYHQDEPASSDQQTPLPPSGPPSGPEPQDSSGQFEVYPAVPERESPPPPVPPKDIAGFPPISHSKLGGDAKNTIPVHNLAERSRTSSTLGMRHIVSAIASFPAGARGPASPTSEPLSPGSARSSASATSGSGLSIGVPQKPSRLQRLLGGEARLSAGSPPVQGTPDLEQEFVPVVPREAEHKLHEQAGRPLSGAKRRVPRSRSSLDTLKTIFSVGSLETSLDAVNALQTAPNVPKPDSKPGLWKQTLSVVPVSIANAAAHVIPRKPITRKPVPIRQESAAEVNSTSNESDNHSVLPPPLRPSHRTASLTFLGERRTKLKHRLSDQTLTRSTADYPFPAPPSPIAKALSLENTDKTSKPANSTRRPLSLRVPPPLRSQSVASVSRRTSRESLQSYPAMHSLASKTSMDSLQSYSSSQPGVGSGSVPSISPGEGSMDPRRLQSFRQYHSPQSSPYSSPDWETQTDLGTSHRRNSISSVQSEGGFHAGNSQGWQIRTAQQTLRHRASYDGYGQPQRFSQNGHPPSMSNGYTAPVKPGYGPPPRRQLDAASTWSRSQADAAAGQRYQGGGQYHLQAPRGHYRNRSMGNGNGLNPPYRVLHSYNSPAYRNAPIWG